MAGEVEEEVLQLQEMAGEVELVAVKVAAGEQEAGEVEAGELEEGVETGLIMPPQMKASHLRSWIIQIGCFESWCIDSAVFDHVLVTSDFFCYV